MHFNHHLVDTFLPLFIPKKCLFHMTVYGDDCGDERRKLFPFILTSFSFSNKRDAKEIYFIYTIK